MKHSIEVLSDAIKVGHKLRCDVGYLERFLSSTQLRIEGSSPEYLIKPTNFDATPLFYNALQDGMRARIMDGLARCEAVGIDVADLRAKAESLLTPSPT